VLQLRQQHRLRLSQGAAALAAVAALSFFSIPPAGAGGREVATSDDTVLGSGPPDWRRQSTVAGPVGVPKGVLQRMSETGNGQRTAKMPLLLAGSASVVVTVPPRQRSRVFLYYGRYTDRDGNPTKRTDAPGFSEVEFQPCANRPRSPFAGAIRIARGAAPVRLTVRVEGRSKVHVLRLGRPALLRPE
jgi:hypothetical protein